MKFRNTGCEYVPMEEGGDLLPSAFVHEFVNLSVRCLAGSNTKVEKAHEANKR